MGFKEMMEAADRARAEFEATLAPLELVLENNGKDRPSIRVQYDRQYEDVDSDEGIVLYVGDGEKLGWIHADDFEKIALWFLANRTEAVERKENPRP